MSSRIPTEFDVLVIGGGHAGIETALAATRLGGTVALLTHDLEVVLSIHDVIAATVCVDFISQRIFDSREEKEAFIKKRAAEQAEKAAY